MVVGDLGTYRIAGMGEAPRGRSSLAWELCWSLVPFRWRYVGDVSGGTCYLVSSERNISRIVGDSARRHDEIAVVDAHRGTKIFRGTKYLVTRFSPGKTKNKKNIWWNDG
ncbi:hypothetical protein TWF751_010887 [Orbilia oligospora]|nr:hypothetical protein TWF751_010887 [Orbilia oligospora]